MADYFDIICATSQLCERSFCGLPIREFADVNVQEPFEVRRLAEFPKGKEFTKFFSLRLDEVFREKQFDFILVDSEASAGDRLLDAGQTLAAQSTLR